MLGRLLLATAAAQANRGHEVAQFVRARAGLLKSIVLFRTHVDDALTIRIYKSLHASLNGPQAISFGGRVFGAWNYAVRSLLRRESFEDDAEDGEQLGRFCGASFDALAELDLFKV